LFVAISPMKDYKKWHKIMITSAAEYKADLA
jgi:hypothetical protein